MMLHVLTMKLCQLKIAQHFFLNEWTLTYDMAMIQPSFTSSKWNMGETALRFLLCN